MTDLDKIDFVKITEQSHDVLIDVRYATDDNFTGVPVYKNEIHPKKFCYLHKEANEKLLRAMSIAKALGLRFKLFDAYRPTEAQWVLWNHTPDPDFLANPERGSPHSRGVAIDLNLIDANGVELDMGTAFDEFSPLSHHGVIDGISVTAQQNRLTLMGIMTAAGWDFYRNEWWHYQLFDSKKYPLISDKEHNLGFMP